MAKKMTLLELAKEWTQRVNVEKDTLRGWPFQLMDFAACQIYTQNARIEGWFEKNSAPFFRGEADREHNYLVSCSLIRRAISTIETESWELAKKALRYTSNSHLKKATRDNEFLMKSTKQDHSKGCPFDRIKSDLHLLHVHNREIHGWFECSSADAWDRGPGNFRTSHQLILNAHGVILQELLLLQEYALKYELSDDFH